MGIFDILPWWTWAIGTFGITGLIAFVLLAPAAANALFSFILNRLGAALGTPVGAGLIVGSLALGLGYLWGGFSAESKCNAAIEQMKEAAREAADARDSAIGRIIEQKFKPVADALEAQSGDFKKQVDAYEQQINGQGSVRCPLGPEPLRLRRRK